MEQYINELKEKEKPIRISKAKASRLEKQKEETFLLYI
jgi:hypothetical protein